MFECITKYLLATVRFRAGLGRNNTGPLLQSGMPLIIHFTNLFEFADILDRVYFPPKIKDHVAITESPSIPGDYSSGESLYPQKH